MLIFRILPIQTGAQKFAKKNLLSYMNSFKSVTNITGWLVFAIAAVVYILTAEPTGSLWDCGEFILGAYKLEVVHPPGAPLFMIVGRMFILVAELFTDTDANPENIAFAVNVMSGICTAFGAMFVAWVAMILGKMTLVGRDGKTDMGENIALAGTGLVAGLATTFASSIWFSAVEGEVYAMSTFFTCLTLWTTIKWYHLPDTPSNDRWLVLTVFVAALSIGVHLLSLLTFPALAIFYYFKKYKEHSVIGVIVAAALGALAIFGIQTVVITGVAEMWKEWELFTVNSLGMSFHSGLIPTLLIILGMFAASLHFVDKGKNGMAHFIFWTGVLAILCFGKIGVSIGGFLALGVLGTITYFICRDKVWPAQLLITGALMAMVGFSTIGVILVRANAEPPINMNSPSDPIRLLSYVNREQYGERPLLYGPHFGARPSGNETEERYGQVEVEENGKVKHRYEIVDEKLSYKYDAKDKQFFPRMGDDTQNRPEKYRAWVDKSRGTPNFIDNVKYLFRYQLGWMYWRYFAWNFVGRQNGAQGYYSWDKKSGHWESGVKFLDEWRLYNMDEMPDTMKKHRANNHYYFLPLLFGLLGLVFHFYKRPKDALGLLALFVITGIGIIIYSNQPPNEPRERDYVLVGSFFTYAIWIGMGVLGLFSLLKNAIGKPGAAALGALVVLSAPLIMGAENWDDHTRAEHYGARDYAANFLESCDPNAIIFTYGDNDTYPLWYAQEVENIRTDVRVVNLSLIQVDWYINLLRRQVNDSKPVKMTVPKEAYRGKNRNAVYYFASNDKGEMSALDVLEAVGQDRQSRDSRISAVLPTKTAYLPVNVDDVYKHFGLNPADSLPIVDKIPLKMPLHQTGQEGIFYITKDELAVLDVVASNINDRPVYFAVTCRPDKMYGLKDYMQLEGLGLRIVPVKSQSEQGLYVYGYGRVNTDKIYDLVVANQGQEDKPHWRWGNFDTHETFIDRSYGPSIQSMRVICLRAARRMNDKGEKDKAVELIEKYLAAFPHFNFPYDWNTMQMLNVMINAGAYDKAKPHLETLAEETRQHLKFYNSIDPSFTDPNGDFEQDYALAINAKEGLLRAVRNQGDDEFLQKLEEMFKPYPTPTRVPN